jgi:hypothetical protein
MKTPVSPGSIDLAHPLGRSSDTGEQSEARHLQEASPCQALTTLDLSAAVARTLSPFLASGIGFDLRAAVDARRVRLVAIHTIDGRPLPRDWAIPLLRSEVVVACAPLVSPFVGVAALVAKVAVLPKPKVDAATRERISVALADAIFAEVRRPKRVA